MIINLKDFKGKVNMKDNRKTLRILTENPVFVHINEQELEGKFIDLSETGARISIKSSCSGKPPVKFNFTLNSANGPISITGDIIHKKNDDSGSVMGVFFHQEDIKHIEQIMKFIQQHKK